MERKFSLELVRDGITEEADYRLVMACHCPDLILSSLGRLCSYYSIEQDDESCVTMRTLTRLIEIGGVHAVSHIVDRMGLLSWLRSLICEVNKSKHGPSQSARTELLILLAQVLRRATDSLPTKELVAATSGMAQSVLSMTIDTLDVSSENKSHKQLIQQTCTVLSLLQTVLSNSEGARARASFQADGFLIETANLFLSNVTTTEELEAAVCAFCVLPIDETTVDCLRAEAFCMQIMILVTSEILPALQRHTKATVLRRFCVLLKRDWTTDTKGRRKLLDLLLTFWTSCARDSELREAWYQCADMLALSLLGSNSSVIDAHDDDLHSILFRTHPITFDKR